MKMSLFPTAIIIKTIQFSFKNKTAFPCKDTTIYENL